MINPIMNFFCNLIEKVQYNAALAITGAIKSTFQLKIYNKFGIESLKLRRWFRRLCLYEFIPSESHIYSTLTQKMVKLIIAELIYLITLFFHIP